MSDIDTRPAGAPTPNGTEEKDLGVAGKTAKFFINSPLSPLLYLAMFLLGLLGLIVTPRQEDPQISVPMVDIFVQYPGAEADQVASLAIQPLERIMWEIKGVEHVYSASMRGQGIVTVQFEVGQDMGPSLVKVNDQLDSNMDKIPPGVMPPLVKAKGIDDVPIVTVTLWSEKDYNGDGLPDVDDSQLRRLALSVLQSVKEIPETGEGFVVGGRAEQVIVEVYPERLAGYGISLGQVAQAIKAANAEVQAGDVESGGARLSVVAGAFLRSVDDIDGLQVGSHNGVPVYVRDVADVRQGPEDANQLVLYYTGVAAEHPDRAARGIPAVTIAVAKKKGTNGVTVAQSVIDRIESMKGRLIPQDMQVSITRNYGQSADDKVTDLIKKLFIATGFVFLLVWGFFRALRPALVVLLVIPVVLLFTVFCAWIMGFTIDRVSLFALIFAIGILVDDAIVVVENIYRRWLEEGRTDVATAVDAVREVGNPTILATFTVIGALLPMGFVTGMMGPYMLPIPVLGSTAMGISLFAAFVFTPFLAIHRWFRPSMNYLEKAEKREERENSFWERVYRRVLTPLIESRRKARLFRLVMWAIFLLACSMFYFKLVSVKMLPLDNKPEFSVVLDMPEGTALADTANHALQVAEFVRKIPEVTAAQVYAGTARPFDFNGMVRHYYLRGDPWQAEIQVQLLDKTVRDRSSHEIAVDARAQLTRLLAGTGARFAVVEMPPGPPVLQSVVAEVHHEDTDTRHQVALDLTEIFAETESLRDVDNYMREPYDYWHFDVDREKADRRGISVEIINQHLAMALGGVVMGDVKQKAGHEPVNIVIQVPLAERSQVSRLGDILVSSGSPDSVSVPLRELGQFRRAREDAIIYHKDLRPVEYVVADVGGRLAAPVYGMMQVEELLREKQYVAPDGTVLADATYWTGPPDNDVTVGIEWAGEWTVTYETFRDMGIAFAAALVLIYILVVWEFGNFRIPALIMAPIPLTLLGIIPIHAIFFAVGWGGEFTATSMIGWIALAGIIVRNSILLVDFSIHEVQKGTSVPEAVIQACKTRTRPILITALALVCGSFVIFFDPIFQGMAISLASGVLVSTILTLVVIPLGCVNAAESLCAVAGVACDESRLVVTRPDTAGGSGSQGGSSGPSFVMKTWGVVANSLLMGFYAVRGIGLLVKQALVKRARKSASQTDRPAVTAHRKSTSTVTTPVPTTAEVDAGQDQKAAEAAAAAVEKQTPVAKSTTRKGGKPRSRAASKRTSKKVESKAETVAKSVGRSSAAPRIRPKAPSSQAETDAPKKRPLKKETITRAPKTEVEAVRVAPVAKTESRPNVTSLRGIAKRERTVNDDDEAVQTSESKTTPEKVKRGDAPSGAVPTKKTSARRGIRLKSLDDAKDDDFN